MAHKILKHQDLIVYRKAFEASMAIFDISKSFPREEAYSLTDQIRRSSRSVSANIAEACGYMDRERAKELYVAYEEVISMLVSMRKTPDEWIIGDKK